MSFQNTLLLGLGLGGALLLAGCGSDGGTSTATPGNEIDWASYSANKTPISFKTDIMPIFGFSCTASDCHRQDQAFKAGLNLGPKCKYNAATKGCDYPAAPDPDPTQAQPLDQTAIDAVYSSLMEDAKTVTAPATKRVAPGDPEHSFLMQKLADLQNDPKYKYTCSNQDPSHEDPTLLCGTYMPLTGDPLSKGTSRPKFDKLATWIAQGAQKN